MNEMEERAAAKELSESLGFRLIDDDDWMFDENGKRVSACGTHWLLLSGHDDARLDKLIRYGQWPPASEIIIKQLWHCCVRFSAEKAKLDAAQKETRRKLSIAATVVMVCSLTVPLLLSSLHLIGMGQFNRLWSYGTHLAAAAVGGLIVGRSWPLK